MRMTWVQIWLLFFLNEVCMLSPCIISIIKLFFNCIFTILNCLLLEWCYTNELALSFLLTLLRVNNLWVPLNTLSQLFECFDVLFWFFYGWLSVAYFVLPNPSERDELTHTANALTFFWEASPSLFVEVNNVHSSPSDSLTKNTQRERNKENLVDANGYVLGAPSYTVLLLQFCLSLTAKQHILKLRLFFLSLL